MTFSPLMNISISKLFTFNSIQTKQTRQRYIDIAKGLGLLWVVAVHTSLNHSSLSPFLRWSSSFVLPMFFMISGVFHRNLPFRTFLVKKICQLIVPFVCFEFLAIVFSVFNKLLFSESHNILVDVFKSIIAIPYKTNCGPTWFLLALFETTCLYNLLYKLKNIQLIALFIIILSVFGFYINHLVIFGHHCHLPFFLGQALAMFPLYAMGNFFATSKQNKSTSRLYVFLLVFFSIIYIAIQTSFNYFNGMELASAFYRENYVVTLLNAVAGGVFVLFISKLLDLRFFSFLAWIGRCSLFIMSIHALALSVFYHFVKNGLIQFVFALSVSIILFFPCNRYCPFLCGKLRPEQFMSMLKKVHLIQ